MIINMPSTTEPRELCPQTRGNPHETLTTVNTGDALAAPVRENRALYILETDLVTDRPL